MNHVADSGKVTIISVLPDAPDEPVVGGVYMVIDGTGRELYAVCIMTDKDEQEVGLRVISHEDAAKFIKKHTSKSAVN